MIAYLRGIIKYKGAGYVILLAHDIGYQVFVNQVTLDSLAVNQEVELFTHQYVREDALNLYGFKSMEELEFFELLLAVSGIGPKSALGVLSVASLASIKQSIARGDPALLTKVSGIGRKTAERVILELREKIGQLKAGPKMAGDNHDWSEDEIDALMALGYSLSQAREALSQIDPQLKKSSDRIREALRRLGKGGG